MRGTLDPMRRTLVALMATLLLAGATAGCNSNPTLSTAAKRHNYQPTPAPPAGAKFDFYVLNMSWSPEFCSTHPNARECAGHPGFILHGLWPQNNDGTYPSDCSDTYLKDPAQYKDLNPDTHLLIHEWKKHGTCTGLDPHVYFELAREAEKKLNFPPVVTMLHQEDQIQTKLIQSRLRLANFRFPPDGLVLQCGNNRLTAVEACFSKDMTPISCGPSFHSCRAKVITVTPENLQ